VENMVVQFVQRVLCQRSLKLSHQMPSEPFKMTVAPHF